MARFRRGEIVLTLDRRPAVIVHSWPHLRSTRYLLSPITLRDDDDPYSLDLSPSDDVAGKVSERAAIHPLYLFCKPESGMERVGRLTSEKLQEVLDTIHDALDEPDED